MITLGRCEKALHILKRKAELMRSPLLIGLLVGIVVLLVAAVADLVPWLLGLCALLAIGVTIGLALHLIRDAGGLPGDF